MTQRHNILRDVNTCRPPLGQSVLALPCGAPAVSVASAQSALRATTSERGFPAETESRGALTDASRKKRRKFKQNPLFSLTTTLAHFHFSHPSAPGTCRATTAGIGHIGLAQLKHGPHRHFNIQAAKFSSCLRNTRPSKPWQQQ